MRLHILLNGSEIYIIKFTLNVNEFPLTHLTQSVYLNSMDNNTSYLVTQ